MFTWIVGLISIIALVLVAYSDSLTGKGKSSNYFKNVQRPSGKKDRSASIAEPTEYNEFWTKLNSQK